MHATVRRPAWGPDQADRPAVNELLVKLAQLMDDAIPLPGTSRRIGLDGIIGLVPGLGDAATALLGFLLLAEARRLGVSRGTQLRMAANYGLDLLIGAIPLVGDAWDFFFKAHRKNLRLLQEDMARRS